ncbi:DUF4350 domain-containing protein [Aurantiacibacter marinus]|uniref:DUF4350 domain-containing protein n=1 Tax=Aurantiacibacter marinus TaxID=874156 RepID=A0A0H0XQ14_9SPHN|nr:DUF4350 domain-containing protein [Aurantiacibacter marinus]KLI64419.1 hypothetical protein AAV99_02075 [Aurantiacibacter marinus]
MSRAGNPFRPGVVLAVLGIGAVAFLLMLYALGQGWDGSNDRNGGNHAASNGLNGFAGLAGLLEDTGYDVELSRSRASYNEYGLLILTPPMFGDGEELADILDDRRRNDSGPTLVILPKWMAFRIPEQMEVEAEDGWVFLMNSGSPEWFETLDFAEGAQLGLGEAKGWNGLGMIGALPDATQVQALSTQPNNEMRVRVLDSEGNMLVADLPPEYPKGDYDYAPYTVTFVFEPDLMNNYGMADENRARLAFLLIETAVDGDPSMPVIFDLTLPGLGASENLLTLAFSPPFLAATLCLLLAALVIAWRGFQRFGPPVAEPPVMSQGKRQLARNGASLIQRVKRFHLLSDPYAALINKRIGDTLGLREPRPEARAAAIDSALERRGYEGPGYARLAHDLRTASRPRDIIRAAGALKSIERTLKR